MAQKLLSIYITNDTIKICEASKSGKNVKVKRVFQAQTPAGGVEDGLIVDIEGVAAAIYGVLRENKIRKGRLAFTITSRKIANKEVMLPYMRNQKKIMDIINANKEDYFPMNNIEDYICRYTVLDTIEVDGNKQYNISVTAIQKEIIASYTELGRVLKMPVEIIDYYGNSTYQLLRNQMDEEGITLAIQVDSNITYVNVMRGQAQLFRRSVPYGRETLISNLAQFKEITEEEAEVIFTDVQKLDEEVSVEDYAEIVRDMVSAITRVVEFHTSRNPDVIVEHSSLFGEGTNLIGLAEILAKELGVTITAQQQLKGVVVKKNNKFGVTHEVLTYYLPNIGALIQPLEFSVDEEKAGGSVNEYVPYIALVVAAAVAIMGISVFVFVRYNKLMQEKVFLEDQIAKLVMAEDIYTDFLKNKEYYETVEAYYAATKDDNEAMYELFTYIEQIAPTGLGITGMSSQNGEITMTGIAKGKEGIALFVHSLKEADFISEVRVQNINEVYDEFDSPTSTFNMTFHIHHIEETDESVEGGEVQ